MSLPSRSYVHAWYYRSLEAALLLEAQLRPSMAAEIVKRLNRVRLAWRARAYDEQAVARHVAHDERSALGQFAEPADAHPHSPEEHVEFAFVHTAICVVPGRECERRRGKCGARFHPIA
jgi:hypothetical protein